MCIVGQQLSVHKKQIQQITCTDKFLTESSRHFVAIN